MVERFNAHLRDADFTIKTLDDLIRAFETYSDETLEISLPHATVPRMPESVTLPSVPMEGTTPVPNTHQKVQFPREASNASPASAVVARHYCDVDANAPFRDNQRIMATAAATATPFSRIPK